MDYKSFEYLYNDALKALNEHHLMDALTCLNGILYNIDDVELHNEKDSICNDYNFMLNFFKQGGTDSCRLDVYRNIINRAYVLLDRSARKFRLKVYDKQYTKHAGNAIQQTEENPNLLFNRIWTSDIYKTTDSEALLALFNDLDSECQLLVVSAIMLSLQEYFDTEKFKIIIQFCQHTSPYIRARAIVAFVWIYMKHQHRISNQSELKEAISILGGNAKFKSELTILQKELLLSLETANVEKKLQKDIFPDLLSAKELQNAKIDFTFIDEELSKSLEGAPYTENGNPRNKKMANKMKELINMGKEGVDINIGTFAMLKSFPFFMEIAHWFIPFNSKRPEFQQLLGTDHASNPIQMLLNTGNFCDSDKYSLCIMLNQMPAAQRDMVLSQLTAQFDGHEEGLNEIKPITDNIKLIIRNYLQDLYRFYKLHHNRSEFNDPFKMDLLLTNYKDLEYILDSASYNELLGTTLIQRKRYHDAITYLNKVKDVGGQYDLIQKLAYCHQQTGNYRQAISYYEQADLIQPDNEWVIEQMRLCYSALHLYHDELKCLTKLESINTNDSKIVINIGRCLMQMGKYEEAVNRFYEMEYKGEKLLTSRRAIAWCNFKLKKFEQAEKYYQKLSDDANATWEDHMNYGHVLWANHKTQEAIERYKKYISLVLKEKNTEPLKAFDKDKKELLKQGIQEVDIDMMRDILAQSIMYNEG